MERRSFVASLLGALFAPALVPTAAKPASSAERVKPAPFAAKSWPAPPDEIEFVGGPLDGLQRATSCYWRQGPGILYAGNYIELMDLPPRDGVVESCVKLAYKRLYSNVYVVDRVA